MPHHSILAVDAINVVPDPPLSNPLMRTELCEYTMHCNACGVRLKSVLRLQPGEAHMTGRVHLALVEGMPKCPCCGATFVGTHDPNFKEAVDERKS